MKRLEVIMIDPFFFDRLMRAFTAQPAPGCHAGEPGATNRCKSEPPGASSTCRVIREAEEIVAEVFRRGHSSPAGTPQADGHV
jgi:hypothetical protein